MADGSETAWRREFVGVTGVVGSAARWLDSIVTRLGLPDGQANAMQVCLEELVSNIVRHGGVDPASAPPGPGSDAAPALAISICVAALPDRIVLTIEDNGRRFDVVQAPAGPIDAPLECVVPGGLGIQLVKSLASSLRYCRIETGNRVVAEFAS